MIDVDRAQPDTDSITYILLPPLTRGPSPMKIYDIPLIRLILKLKRTARRV